LGIVFLLGIFYLPNGLYFLADLHKKANVRLIDECSIRKYLERSDCDLVELLSRRLAGGTEEIHANFSQNSLVKQRDSKTEPTEDESEIAPTCSVPLYINSCEMPIFRLNAKFTFLLTYLTPCGFRFGLSQQNAQWIWSSPLNEIKILGCVWVIVWCYSASPSLPPRTQLLAPPSCISPFFTSLRAKSGGQIKNNTASTCSTTEIFYLERMIRPPFTPKIIFFYETQICIAVFTNSSHFILF
jgi:hypothetical protein